MCLVVGDMYIIVYILNYPINILIWMTENLSAGGVYSAGPAVFLNFISGLIQKFVSEL